MRVQGTFTRWNDDRGFGFIALDQGGSEIFVHVSAFSKGDQPPTPGERVTFEIEVVDDGKKRAKNLIYPNRPAVRKVRQADFSHSRKKHGIFGKIFPLVVVAVLALVGYYSRSTVSQENTQSSDSVVSQVEVAPQQSQAIVSSSFRCDGRKYCSQMTSCDEATFFLRSCPSVEMDGDQDGVACEQQWCN